MIDKLHHKPFVFQDFSEMLPSRQFGAGNEPELQMEQPEEPPAPSFSEEELLAAQREAEEIGRQKGYEDAKREWDELAQMREAQIIALLETLTTRLDDEVSQQEKQQNSQRGDVANVVLMIARKLAGNAMETQPLGTIEPMVNECLTLLAGKARLTIAVNEALKEPLAAYLATLQREGQTVEISADPTMQPGDCRIEWPGGKAERNQEALWKEMENIVTRALSASDKTPKQPEG